MLDAGDHVREHHPEAAVGDQQRLREFAGPEPDDDQRQQRQRRDRAGERDHRLRQAVECGRPADRDAQRYRHDHRQREAGADPAQRHQRMGPDAHAFGKPAHREFPCALRDARRRGERIRPQPAERRCRFPRDEQRGDERRALEQRRMAGQCRPRVPAHFHRLCRRGAHINATPARSHRAAAAASDRCGCEDARSRRRGSRRCRRRPSPPRDRRAPAIP